MLLSSHSLASILSTKPEDERDPFVVAPCPNLDKLRKSGGASIDLRLGTWFVSMKARRTSLLDVYEHDDYSAEVELTNKYYVPFGDKFILHPKAFILAVTLEWLRFPLHLAGMVTGKSSWGRRGLIIETAPGVHPGFTGCLTLELTNVGEVPIAISPGTEICQLFVHKLESPVPDTPESKFLGQRQPVLSGIRPDQFAINLMQQPASPVV